MDVLTQVVAALPAGFLSAVLMNGTVIALAYFIVWKLYGARFQHRRIQQKQRADAKQIRSELKNALLPLSVGALFASIVMLLTIKGHTQIYTNFSDHHPLVAVAGFFILWMIDDTWFYFVHRFLHHPFVYRHVHAVHHRSVDVTPFTSLSFHWLEPFLLSMWVIPVVLFVPVYAPVLAIIQVVGLLDNVKSHLGYEFYPAGLNRSPLRFLTSSTYHNMHHTKFTGNYGVHFRFWDKLLGTELPHYESEYDRVKQRDRDGELPQPHN
jgi:Delta7-sterol 5-desaturase